ncbi:hypothetical protein Bca4012_035430 [Brassica carinata]
MFCASSATPHTSSFREHPSIQSRSHPNPYSLLHNNKKTHDQISNRTPTDVRRGDLIVDGTKRHRRWILNHRSTSKPDDSAYEIANHRSQSQLHRVEETTVYQSQHHKPERRKKKKENHHESLSQEFFREKGEILPFPCHHVECQIT